MGSPVLLERPEFRVGCYDLHLYCRYKNSEHGSREFPHEYNQGHETGASARREARQNGWILHKDGTSTCPKCARALAAHPRTSDPAAPADASGRGS